MSHIFRAAMTAAFTIHFAMVPLSAQDEPESPDEPTIKEQISSNLVEGLDALQKADYADAHQKCKISQFLSGASAKKMDYFEYSVVHGMASACIAKARLDGKMGDVCSAVKIGKEDFVQALVLTAGHEDEKNQLMPFAELNEAVELEAGCTDD